MVLEISATPYIFTFKLSYLSRPDSNHCGTASRPLCPEPELIPPQTHAVRGLLDLVLYGVGYPNGGHDNTGDRSGTLWFELFSNFHW